MPVHDGRAEELERQAREFALRCFCEDCVHFSPTRQACGHGYPTAPHRRSAGDPIEAGDTITFCKEFELA